MRPKWDVATTSHAGWVFTITTFSDFPIYFWSRPKAINCIAALEHKVDMCWSNCRRSLIVMASSFTDLVDSITLLSIDSLYLASLSFLFKTIAWNLSALTIILFCLYQLTADSDSCSKVFKSPVKVLQVAVMVLSLAKLCKSDFLMHRNKSMRNILKRIGPNIEPCGTPDKIFWNALKMLFILIFCFRSFKYEFRKVTVSKLSP